MNFRRSIIVVELWRPKVVENFCEKGAFLENRPLTETFQLLFRRDSPSHRTTYCSNFLKSGRRKIGEIVRCLLDKKHTSLGSTSLATARFVPKIWPGQPQQYTRSVPDFIEIGSLAAELYSKS